MIAKTTEAITASVVIAFLVDHADLPTALIPEKTNLSLFFIPGQKEIPFYFLDPVIILLVDAGNHHVPLSFHVKPVIITAASFKVVIGFPHELSFVITFVKVHRAKLLVVLLIVSLIIALIISLIKGAVVPVARLSLGQEKHSDCEQKGKDFFHVFKF